MTFKQVLELQLEEYGPERQAGPGRTGGLAPGSDEQVERIR